jgi:hypothetical protein
VKPTIHPAGAALLIALAAAPECEAGRRPKETEPWVVSEACHGRFQTHVTVRVDSRSVWSGALKVCRAARNTLPTPFIEFTFVSDSEGISESGYREKAQTFTANLWLSGAESDGVLLGLSMTAPNGASLNTLHYADALKTTEWRHAPRVWVRTTAWLRR